MTQGHDPIRRFADETWPDERELARYNQQLNAIAEGAAKPAWPAWWLPATVGGFAAAAALLIALNPTKPEIVAPKALAMSFEPTGIAVQSNPTDKVALFTDGVAALSGTELAPVLDLTSGSVKVQVEPNQGVNLRVRTPDGEVQVLGTVFGVDRSALGTVVSVERGKVAVRCTDGVAHAGLVAGETALCLPSTAEGMLGRAAALDAANAAPAEVGAAIEAGLGSASGATRAELLALRMDQALERADHVAALADAKAYLETGENARREHALRVAARLSAAEGCPAAQLYLNELRAMGPANPEPELSAQCAQR